MHIYASTHQFSATHVNTNNTIDMVKLLKQHINVTVVYVTLGLAECSAFHQCFDIRTTKVFLGRHHNMYLMLDNPNPGLEYNHIAWFLSCLVLLLANTPMESNGQGWV